MNSKLRMIFIFVFVTGCLYGQASKINDLDDSFFRKEGFDIFDAGLTKNFKSSTSFLDFANKIGLAYKGIPYRKGQGGDVVAYKAFNYRGYFFNVCEKTPIGDEDEKHFSFNVFVSKGVIDGLPMVNGVNETLKVE